MTQGEGGGRPKRRKQKSEGRLVGRCTPREEARAKKAAAKVGETLSEFVRAGAWFRSRLVEAVRVEVEQEEDGRWIVDVPAIPGALAYGKTREEAAKAAVLLALDAVAEKLEAKR